MEINGHDTYYPYTGKDGKYYNPDEYRAGVAYLDVFGLRIGRNSENIRYALQNRLAHDIATGGKAKWFKVLPIEPTWYWGFSTGTGGTMW